MGYQAIGQRRVMSSHFDGWTSIKRRLVLYCQYHGINTLCTRCNFCGDLRLPWTSRNKAVNCKLSFDNKSLLLLLICQAYLMGWILRIGRFYQAKMTLHRKALQKTDDVQQRWWKVEWNPITSSHKVKCDVKSDCMAILMLWPILKI